MLVLCSLFSQASFCSLLYHSSSWYLSLDRQGRFLPDTLLHVGHKGEKFRDIDLLNEARRPLYDYLQHGGRDSCSPYVFTSQRNDQLTEAGIHHWFRSLKRQANKEQWDLIADLSFHDLRHDFAHRAREAGWTLEEIAYYLGHVTVKGTPAIQTTARYTQVNRAQVKEKLQGLKG